MTLSLTFTVRTHSSHRNAPSYQCDNISERFLRDSFKVTVQDFATRFEAYALSGVKGLADANNNKRRVDKKIEIRQMITNQLSMYFLSSCMILELTYLY